MKIYYIIVLISLSLNSYSQSNENLKAHSDSIDVVYLKNGSIIRGSIIELVPNRALKIKTRDNSIFVYEFEEVTDILKELDPKKQEEDRIKKQQEQATEYNYQIAKGQTDAKTYYRGYRGAQLGTFFTSLTCGPLGLIPAIACSKSTPKLHLHNKRYTHLEYMNNEYYASAYKQKAHRMKKVKVWTMFGVGIGINFIALYTVLNVLSAK